MQRGTRISFSSVNSSLSSLKNCQSYINTGMDIATHVALDLVENFRRFHSSHLIVFNNK
uniref:Uncharacterized protein n=1 Tax=Pavo cristatus TaxID=9049 RepID=A0A8C9FTZ0_PAVCR